MSGTATQTLADNEELLKCIDFLLNDSVGLDFLLASWTYIKQKNFIDSYDFQMKQTLVGDYDLKGFMRYELIRKLTQYLDELAEGDKENA